MDPDNYNNLRLKADRISREKSVLNYFYSLCDKGMLRFEGKMGKEYFFGYPDQRTGSIAVSDGKNKWFDHSRGVGGDVIKAVNFFEGKGFMEAVEQLDLAVHPEWHPKSNNRPTREDAFKIIKASADINHPALVSYIHSRGLEPQYFSGIAKEVHWLKDDRKFFGLGFINDGDGYAIRSRMFKFNIGSNRVTHVQIGNSPLGIKIFEGGFDLASFRKLFPSSRFKAIVLNGLGNFTPLLMEEINFDSMGSNTKVELYLDNDPAGDEKTATAMENIKWATDGRRLYTGFQDLNDFLVSGQDRKLGR